MSKFNLRCQRAARARSRLGQASIEFLLAAPSYLLLFLLILNGCEGYLLRWKAQAGARAAACTRAYVEQRAEQELPLGGEGRPVKLAVPNDSELFLRDAWPESLRPSADYEPQEGEAIASGEAGSGGLPSVSAIFLGAGAIDPGGALEVAGEASIRFMPLSTALGAIPDDREHRRLYHLCGGDWSFAEAPVPLKFVPFVNDWLGDALGAVTDVFRFMGLSIP